MKKEIDSIREMFRSKLDNEMAELRKQNTILIKNLKHKKRLILQHSNANEIYAKITKAIDNHKW